MSVTSEAIERMERRAEWVKTDAGENVRPDELYAEKNAAALKAQLRNTKKVLQESIAIIDKLI